jgi:hypothetical protein
VTLNAMQEGLCTQSQWDFSNLRALFVNCTLKKSPEISNTQGLADISMEIMRRQGVRSKPYVRLTMTSPPECGPT